MIIRNRAKGSYSLLLFMEHVYVIVIFFSIVTNILQKIILEMTRKAEGFTVYNRVTINSNTITLIQGEGTKCSLDKSGVRITYGPCIQVFICKPRY